MYSPRLKALEHTAHAAGSAFGFDEADFDAKYSRTLRPGRVAVLVLAIGGASLAVAHHYGFTSLIAALGGWRGAA